LGGVGSRWVAGWVAALHAITRHIHAALPGLGSRCSTFFNKLCIRERRTRERVELTIGTTCYTCYPAAELLTKGVVWNPR
jgi:hypothetical protein